MGTRLGGKPKGYRDKYTVAHFKKVLAKHKCDPFEDLVVLIPNLTPDKQAAVLTTVLSYVSRRPETASDGTGDLKPAGRSSPMSVKTTDELIKALQSQNNEKQTIGATTESEE